LNLPLAELSHEQPGYAEAEQGECGRFGHNGVRDDDAQTFHRVVKVGVVRVIACAVLGVETAKNRRVIALAVRCTLAAEVELDPVKGPRHNEVATDIRAKRSTTSTKQYL